MLCRDSNSRPLDYQSPPITTRPVVPPFESIICSLFLKLACLPTNVCRYQPRTIITVKVHVNYPEQNSCNSIIKNISKRNLVSKIISKSRFLLLNYNLTSGQTSTCLSRRTSCHFNRNERHGPILRSLDDFIQNKHSSNNPSRTIEDRTIEIQ